MNIVWANKEFRFGGFSFFVLSFALLFCISRYCEFRRFPPNEVTEFLALGQDLMDHQKPNRC